MKVEKRKWEEKTSSYLKDFKIFLFDMIFSSNICKISLILGGNPGPSTNIQDKSSNSDTKDKDSKSKEGQSGSTEERRSSKDSKDRSHHHRDHKDHKGSHRDHKDHNRHRDHKDRDYKRSSSSRYRSFFKKTWIFLHELCAIIYGLVWTSRLSNPSNKIHNNKKFPKRITYVTNNYFLSKLI